MGRGAAVDYYAMLFPSRPTPARYLRVARRWAAGVGGDVNPAPHTTVAYLVGRADPHDVAEALRAVPLAAVPVEAVGAVSYGTTPHPLFGYSASLRVVKTPELGDVHRAVVAAVRPLGLASLYRWEDVDPHLQVLRHLTTRPSDVLPRLAALGLAHRFVAARLVVSRPAEDGTFPVLLDRPLRAGRPAAAGVQDPRRAEQHPAVRRGRGGASGGRH